MGHGALARLHALIRHRTTRCPGRWTITYNPGRVPNRCLEWRGRRSVAAPRRANTMDRSEEHTSELPSPCKLVCRLLLEKKKQRKIVAQGGDAPPSLSRRTGRCGD